MHTSGPNDSLSMQRLQAYKISRPWIYEHLSELQAKGWTRRELFNAGLNLHKNRQLGPALDIAWLQPQVKVSIGDNGTIFWTWPRGENKFTTKAKPVPRSSKRQAAANKKTEASMSKDYINLSQLKRRGWTIKLIADFLPEHDKEAPNPVDPDWAPQKLYLLNKVEEIEQDEYFQRRKEWANGFQARMKEVKRQERERRLKE